MKKIPTLFVRDPDDRAHVLPYVTPGCEWVLAGEGRATRKWDGTCVMLDEHGDWWARREVKIDRLAPPGFMPVEWDPTTGKTVGWEPAEQSPFAAYIAEAATGIYSRVPSTFELIGPKVNGNPEGCAAHALMRHGEFTVPVPRTFDSLHAVLIRLPYEGVVWWHPDGRMAKLKRRDFPAAA